MGVSPNAFASQNKRAMVPRRPGTKDKQNLSGTQNGRMTAKSAESDPRSKRSINSKNNDLITSQKTGSKATKEAKIVPYFSPSHGSKNDTLNKSKNI